MSKEKKKPVAPTEAAAEATTEQPAAVSSQVEAEQGAGESSNPLQSALEQMTASLAEQEDKYLRLAAEYDNYRKRTQKEKDSIWADCRAETAGAFLPVYDNLERALKQETADEAYAKGVEMIMSGLRDVLGGLGIQEIAALGAPFDANLHNAVVHVEDEAVGESTVTEVFQAGFKSGEKVIRFAMVKVAN